MWGAPVMFAWPAPVFPISICMSDGIAEIISTSRRDGKAESGPPLRGERGTAGEEKEN